MPSSENTRDASDSRKRILILGCGYVGSAVAHAALARGWSVAALTRNEAGADELRARGVNVFVGDLASHTWHAVLPTAQDFILNCVSSGGGGLAGYRHSYVEGMKSILNWAGRGGTHATYVYTSSTSVYPQANGEIITEDAPTGGGSEAAEPLLEAEALVRSSACFARWFILRLAGIYGPNRHYLVDQMRAGATLFPGTGTHRLNLAHRDDIVSAIFACLDAPANVRDAIFNVADDAPATKSEVAAWLANRLSVREPEFAHDVSRASAKRADDTTRVRGRSGPVPDRIIRADRIKQTLGWRPAFPDFRSGYAQIFATEKTTSPDPGQGAGSQSVGC